MLHIGKSAQCLVLPQNLSTEYICTVQALIFGPTKLALEFTVQLVSFVWFITDFNLCTLLITLYHCAGPANEVLNNK